MLERGNLGIGDRLGPARRRRPRCLGVHRLVLGPGSGRQGVRHRLGHGNAGKVVFFLGVAVVVVVVLREVGVELPAAVPESLLTIALGALATIIVLVRVISIPDDFFFAGRGVGIWISLVAAIGVIVAGLLQASEEL